MATKVSLQEPADREFTVALSHAEMIALVKWHTSQVRATTKRFGSAALDMQRFNVIPSGANLKSLHDVAKSQIVNHTSRARELRAVLKLKSANRQP